MSTVLGFYNDSLIPNLVISNSTFPFSIRFYFAIDRISNIDLFISTLNNNDLVGTFSMYNPVGGAYIIGGAILFDNTSGNRFRTADISLNIGQNGLSSIYDTIGSLVLDFTQSTFNGINGGSVITIRDFGTGSGIKLMLSNVSYDYENPNNSGSIIISDTWIAPVNGTIEIPPENPSPNLFNDIVKVDNDVILTTNYVPYCFCKSTLILTPDGYKTIETLKSGEFIMVKSTVDNSVYSTKILYIIKQTFDQQDVYCIKQNAFGENKPFEDLYLSKRHVVETSSGFRHIGCFHDNSKNMDIEIKQMKNVEFYNIKIENWSNQIICSNGIFAESYNDNKKIGWVCNKNMCSYVDNLDSFLNEYKHFII